jgi:hypothetical protein
MKINQPKQLTKINANNNILSHYINANFQFENSNIYTKSLRCCEACKEVCKEVCLRYDQLADMPKIRAH